jgi:phenylacetate-CoA ligase
MERLGLRPSDFKTAQDLTRLPIIEREQLGRDPEYFVSKADGLKSYCRVTSGGTTGTPRILYHDARGLFQHKAQAERSRMVITKVLGQRFRYRDTRIGLYDSVTRQMDRFLSTRGIWPSLTSIYRQDLDIGDPIEKNVALIEEFKPDVIQSYASYLSLLYAYLMERGEPFHNPKVILYYGDAMPESVKRMFEKELKIPVFGYYGAAEAMGIGFDCEYHTGLHINTDIYPIRILNSDGRPLPEGESGDVVISNLVNRGTVLLNYRLGDISAALPVHCQCGRSLPLISYPPGRRDDVIQLPSGKIVHPLILRFIFEHEEVWEYQVVQRTRTSFEALVVPRPKCDLERTREHIKEEFARYLGIEIAVEIFFVPSIDRSRSGKSRLIISMVQNSQSDLSLDEGEE